MVFRRSGPSHTEELGETKRKLQKTARKTLFNHSSRVCSSKNLFLVRQTEEENTIRQTALLMKMTTTSRGRANANNSPTAWILQSESNK